MITKIINKILNLYFKFKREPKMKIRIYKEKGKWRKSLPESTEFYAQDNCFLEENAADCFIDYLNTEDNSHKEYEKWNEYVMSKMALEFFKL